MKNVYSKFSQTKAFSINTPISHFNNYTYFKIYTAAYLFYEIMFLGIFGFTTKTDWFQFFSKRFQQKLSESIQMWTTKPLRLKVVSLIYKHNSIYLSEFVNWIHCTQITDLKYIQSIQFKVKISNITELSSVHYALNENEDG